MELYEALYALYCDKSLCHPDSRQKRVLVEFFAGHLTGQGDARHAISLLPRARVVLEGWVRTLPRLLWELRNSSPATSAAIVRVIGVTGSQVGGLLVSGCNIVRVFQPRGIAVCRDLCGRARLLNRVSNRGCSQNHAIDRRKTLDTMQKDLTLLFHIRVRSKNYERYGAGVPMPLDPPLLTRFRCTRISAPWLQDRCCLLLGCPFRMLPVDPFF